MVRLGRLLCRLGWHDMRPERAEQAAADFIEQRRPFRCSRCGAREDG